MKNGFVNVDGLNFAVNDEIIRFRGYGIGNWLNLEHFMIGLNGTDTQIRTAIKKAYGEESSYLFWKKYYESYITEEDFKFLKKIRVNSLRIPFNYRLFESDLDPYNYKKEGFQQIDRILKLCEKYEIYAILDLHSVPGGQNPDWHSDNSMGEPLHWRYLDFQKRTIELWKYIADHYKNNKWIAAYDLMNEPVTYQSNGKILDQFFQVLVKEIRIVDPNHLLFIEGDCYSQRFENLSQPQDSNVAYSFHFYPWAGITNYNDYQDEAKRKKNVRRLILGSGAINEIKNRLKRPIWLGETGTGSNIDNREIKEKIFSDIIHFCEDSEISWSIWCYKDARAMGTLRPKEDSSWMNFSNLVRKDYVFGKEFGKYNSSPELITTIENSANLPEKILHKIKFRILANSQLELCTRYKDIFAEIPFEELLTYPKSFLFKNCEIWTSMTEMVQKFTKVDR